MRAVHWTTCLFARTLIRLSQLTIVAVSIVVVGAFLAASTGIVGATVVTMGLLSLPAMLSRNYSPRLASGVICASGTLGQIIPPSVVLVLLGSVLNVSVGNLFLAAVVPGIDR